MTITIYSTSNCAICRAEMRWLDEKNVGYEHVIVDEAPDGMQRLMEASGGAIGVPYTTVTGDDGQTTGIAGFDQGQLKQAIGI